MRDALSFRHDRHRAAVTAMRVTAHDQITLFGAGFADSQQTEAGAHNGGTVRAQHSFHQLRSVSRAAAGMAPSTAAQASAGSRVSDGNAHRALPIRTHGAPPQERQIARSVTRARALLAASSARSHPTCRHHSDTADVTHMSLTRKPRSVRCLHHVRSAKSASRHTPRTRCTPGWPTSTRSAAGPAGSPNGPRSAPSRSAWPDKWPTTSSPRPGRCGHRGPSPRSCPACRSWSWPWGPR